MRAALLFVTLIGFVTAGPLVSEQKVNLEQIDTAVGERNGPIETAILDLLESLRQLMVDGTDTIPPLDPLVVGRIHLDDETLPLPGAFITLNDMIVRGISTFRVDDIRLSMASLIPLRQRLDFNVVIPAIDVETSSYALFLRIFGGDIYGKGDMKLTISNARVKGHVTVGLRRDNGVFATITACRISFTLDSFEPVITGMFNDEASSEFVSRFLSNLIPGMLEYFEDDITNILSSGMLIIGNLILANLDLGNLLPSVAP
ncbi:uncharacterized protein LOC123864208 [Maniola jurtina]|uniref:uncharacterized protein LOC123864208 n=1 Tax=Maniola jurtina TaxID=191418 RepID=UPI001E68B9BF|nr:uncharacterized protein LOC123864208 [Maniola jurtina]